MDLQIFTLLAHTQPQMLLSKGYLLCLFLLCDTFDTLAVSHASLIQLSCISSVFDNTGKYFKRKILFE